MDHRAAREETSDLVARYVELTGIVQGVGFRPFVYNLALGHGLRGWVRNTSASVQVYVEGAPAQVDAFVGELRSKAPPLARIESVTVQACTLQGAERFVIEESLSKIFAILYRHRVKVNLVQNSAISFTICVDDEHLRLPGAIEELQKTFTVRFNSNLELLTIRHYTSHVVDEMVGERIVYLQQRTRSNARFIMDARL